jgi:hypothetical protein
MHHIELETLPKKTTGGTKGTTGSSQTVSRKPKEAPTKPDSGTKGTTTKKK